MKKKGFTLIELIAVLVILAILALIVTPLVMNIIRKARISADKRSVDAYGRSIELAIPTYLLDNGAFPTYVSQLTIEYSGDQVECTTTQLNTDSSVYLAECTVGGRSVDYTYGKEETAPTYQAYNVGDEVTYNNVNYYVIKDSDVTEDVVTLLKKEALSSEDTTMYANRSGNNYSGSYGYGSYYYGEGCSVDPESGKSIVTNCKNDYESSKIKVLIDLWAEDNLNVIDLVEDFTGYSVRLITYEELLDNFGYNLKQGDTVYTASAENTPSFIYDGSLYNGDFYWTMSPKEDFTINVYVVGKNQSINSFPVYDNFSIRPVITIKKSALN